MEILDLINRKKIGVYNSCEILQIIGLPTGESPFNIYTLFVFENSEEEAYKMKFLTDNPIIITKNLKIGILKRRVSLKVAQDAYIKIKNTNKLEIFEKETLNIGEMLSLEKQYIASTESNINDIKINNILKNNFENGSYIFEFFDEDKKKLQEILKPVILNKIGEEISKVLPLKISLVSDRIGNIIFQIPINKFKLAIVTGKNENELGLKFFNRIGKDKLSIMISSEFDGHILSYEVIKLKNEENYKSIKVSKKNGVNIMITDHKLIYYNAKHSYVNKIIIDGNMESSQKRIFSINNIKREVEIVSNVPIVVGEEEKYKQYVQKRMYNSQLSDLIKAKSFLQYKNNQKEKALSDLRSLINSYGKNGVYLWDPYAEAEGIKETLYYLKYINVPVKILTDLNTEERQKSYEEFKKDNKEYLFLNIEVRTSRGSSLGKFHDRFLIFPLEKAKVWSIGTSINGLGQAHHIFQEVSQPQYILNTFNELWEELDEEANLVWKNI